MIAMDEPNTASNVPKDHDDQHIVSSDDEDEFEEGEAKLRSIHFLHQKKESSLGGDDDNDDKVTVSSQRYDEMGSFLSRSQRSLDMPDPAPSAEELAARKVVVQEEPHAVHDVEPMSQEEAKAYYMGEEDFRRVDIDVELTTMRWEKAQKVSFDAAQCLFVFRRLAHFIIHHVVTIIHIRNRRRELNLMRKKILPEDWKK